MSYFNKEPPTCKYCSTEKDKTLIKFKKKEDGKWAVMNMDGTPHDRAYCDQMKVKNQQQTPPYQPNHITRQEIPTTLAKQPPPPPPYVAKTSTFPVDGEPKPSQQGVSIFSLHIMVSEQRKETKELRKQIETLASIIDSMAQKQDLLVEKIGYPKPEPVIQEKPMSELLKDPPKNMAKYEQWTHFKCNSCGAIFTKGRVDKDKDLYLCQSCIPPIPPTPTTLLTPERQKAYEENSKKFDEALHEMSKGPEIKAEQKSLSPEEMKEVINPMRVQPQEPTEVMEWQNISEAFICHNCEAKTHNGYMKLGTKLCPDCKTGIEANESGDAKDRSDVNEFVPEPETMPLRSIEDINSEEYSF